jgi:hypothetical protein
LGRTCLTTDQNDKVFDKTLQSYTSKRQIFRLSSEVSEILDEVEDKSQYIREAIVFYHTYKDQIKDERRIRTQKTIGSFSGSEVPKRKIEESESEVSSPGTWVPPWKRS